MRRNALCLLVLAILAVSFVGRAEEVIVVEQEYNIVEQGKEGANARDIRQKLYLSADWVRIDEYAGPGKMPSETFLIDFKTEKIVDLDNEKMAKVTETFAARRKRIDERKANVNRDLDAMPDGPQKEKTARMYKALLDDDRRFKLTADKNGQKKPIAGVDAGVVEISDSKEKDYVPLRAWLHPEIELPYDNAEVLYLLQIIGRKMVDFLRKNKTYFKRLPMEMELDLAAGGSLHTKVLSVEKIDRSKLDEFINQVPERFEEKAVRKPPVKKDKD